MLEVQAYCEKKITLGQLIAGLTRDDLRRETDEMIELFLGQIAGCVDADVVFQPVDPLADDDNAATPEEVHMAWTLGHVIVHTTASAEEAAALAAELARGVAPHGRSRHEVHWTGVRTIAACRERLEESRRMRLAGLGMWPASAHLQNEREAWPKGPVVNAVGLVVLDLMHEHSHLGQIGDIVQQAFAARRKH
jgi:hypothetical protein